MPVIQNIQNDIKIIAADVVTIGGSVSAVIATIVNVAPTVHIPASTTAILISASSVIATIIAEARRIRRTNNVVPVTPPAPTPAGK